VAALLWWRGRKGPVPRFLQPIFSKHGRLSVAELNELIAFMFDLFYNWNVYAEQVWGEHCFEAPATDGAHGAQ